MVSIRISENLLFIVTICIFSNKMILSCLILIHLFKDEAQTALFEDPVRTAL